MERNSDHCENAANLNPDNFPTEEPNEKQYTRSSIVKDNHYKEFTSESFLNALTNRQLAKEHENFYYQFTQRRVSYVSFAVRKDTSLKIDENDGESDINTNADLHDTKEPNIKLGKTKYGYEKVDDPVMPMSGPKCKENLIVSSRVTLNEKRPDVDSNTDACLVPVTDEYEDDEDMHSLLSVESESGFDNIDIMDSLSNMTDSNSDSLGDSSCQSVCQTVSNSTDTLNANLMDDNISNIFKDYENRNLDALKGNLKVVEAISMAHSQHVKNSFVKKHRHFYDAKGVKCATPPENVKIRKGGSNDSQYFTDVSSLVRECLQKLNTKQKLKESHKKFQHSSYKRYIFYLRHRNLKNNISKADVSDMLTQLEYLPRGKGAHREDARFKPYSRKYGIRHSQPPIMPTQSFTELPGFSRESPFMSPRFTPQDSSTLDTARFYSQLRENLDSSCEHTPSNQVETVSGGHIDQSPITEGGENAVSVTLLSVISTEPFETATICDENCSNFEDTTSRNIWFDTHVDNKSVIEHNNTEMDDNNMKMDDNNMKMDDNDMKMDDNIHAMEEKGIDQHSNFTTEEKGIDQHSNFKMEEKDINRNSNFTMEEKGTSKENHNTMEKRKQKMHRRRYASLPKFAHSDIRRKAYMLYFKDPWAFSELYLHEFRNWDIILWKKSGAELEAFLLYAIEELGIFDALSVVYPRFSENEPLKSSYLQEINQVLHHEYNFNPFQDFQSDSFYHSKGIKSAQPEALKDCRGSMVIYMHNFIRELMVIYHKDNPYHNFYHVVAVFHSLWMFLVKYKCVHYFTTLEQFSLLMAALSHDIDHPGVNNQFLRARMELEGKIVEEDFPILETHHANEAVKLATASGSWIHMIGEVKRNKFLYILHQAVLATDMKLMLNHRETMHKLFDTVRRFGSDKTWCRIGASTGPSECSDVSPDEYNIYKTEGDAVDNNHVYHPRAGFRNRFKLMKCMLHIADIGNAMMPCGINRFWASLLTQEFNAQTDLECKFNIPVSTFLNAREPADRIKSQINFMEFVLGKQIRYFVKLIPRAAELLYLFSENFQDWHVDLANLKCDADARDFFTYRLKHLAFDGIEGPKCYGTFKHEADPAYTPPSLLT